MTKKTMILGISGASGVLYAISLLKALEKKAKIHLVVSDVAKSILKHEAKLDIEKQKLSDYFSKEYGIKNFSLEYELHQAKNFYAAIASGSFYTDGMIVAPCSMKTLSGIAQGSSSNLIERAADVTLKERRKLILLTRETPLNRVHIQNMLHANDAGAIILPASPAFYLGQRSLDEMLDFIAGRILNLLGIEHDLFKAWGT